MVQVIGGVDKEPDAYNAYLGNIIPANDHVTINRAISLTEFNAGESFPSYHMLRK
jgi:hypothetical protein